MDPEADRARHECPGGSGTRLRQLLATERAGRKSEYDLINEFGASEPVQVCDSPQYHRGKRQIVIHEAADGCALERIIAQCPSNGASDRSSSNNEDLARRRSETAPLPCHLPHPPAQHQAGQAASKYREGGERVHSVPGGDDDQPDREQGGPREGGDNPDGRWIPSMQVEPLRGAKERYQGSKYRQVSPRQAPQGKNERRGAAHYHQNSPIGRSQLKTQEATNRGLRQELLGRPRCLRASGGGVGRRRESCRRDSGARLCRSPRNHAGIRRGAIFGFGGPQAVCNQFRHRIHRLRYKP